jgi:hypothetical protein
MTTETAAPQATDDALVLDRFAELTQRKRELDRELKQVKDEMAPLEQELLQRFAENGWQKVSHKGTGYTFYVRQQIWARAADGDKAAACEALRAAGLGDFVAESFNYQSLSAYFRELADQRAFQGEPLTDLEVLLPEELRGSIQLTTDFSLRAAKGA